MTDLVGMSTALVTGGSRGIGRSVAVGLARAGVKTVAITFVENEAAAASTLKAIEEAGAAPLAIRANLARTDDLLEVGRRMAELGRVDALVHCAALGTFKKLSAVRENQWDLTFNVSTRSFLGCVQQVVPLMKEGGAVVAVSSMGSERVMPNYGAMGPAKAALEATVRYLAAELARRNIRVNAVRAGLVRTDALDAIPGGQVLAREVAARTPAGSIAEPAEVADVIMFLLGPASRWIVGQIITVDGGFSLF